MKTLLKNSIPLIALLVLVSCGNDKSAQQAGRGQQAQSVPVFKVPIKSVTAYIDFPANIEGIINSEVRAKISGYITDVLVDEGDKVYKGQPLFKLETQTLSEDAAAAKANVNAAQVEVDKLKPLVDKEIISPVQLETAKAKLQQAKSNYSSITANIGYGTIKSPVNGYVGQIRLRTGALVSPSSQQPLTTVSDISDVYAYFSINEKEYLDFLQNTEGSSKEEKIKNSPPVTLILANGTEYPEKGKIETINSQVSRSTGTISIRARFENKNGLLTNGNSGTIKIPIEYNDVVVVPQQSTFQQQEKTFVYTVAKDTTAASQAIDIRASAENLYVIGSGLKEGATVVGKGLGKLRSGMSIKPQEVPFDSLAKPIQQEFR
ncbi:efflux RND transporter periplasmic adaptor subunit [Pricia sp. S334]|uniref:Efflux RND transporter periplasmic adaptor subunit n=1 Tax=Pricia mediterranea TaxID=3076079 RepID=A0ABU3L1T1_9FLAO|nr:efflux RND transporter periplasmic adaptor subunit [Pricia sp. S334]MDT7827368.1 efflux RND transporter periplasmic adaptor subunit [Pricia sp. S334]